MLLSSDGARVEESATFAYEEATNPTLDDLPGADGRPRVSAIAAVASYLLRRNPEDHPSRMADRLEHTDREHDRAYYPVVTRTLEALRAEDGEEVERAIADLEPYHETFRNGTGIAEVSENYVNIDVCAFVVTARRAGLDVRVDSEYVPDGVHDDEYYPIADGWA